MASSQVIFPEVTPMDFKDFDLKYFISPHVLPLPVGLMMIISGLSGGFHTEWFSFDVTQTNGILMAIIGTTLTFYSLWLARRFMSVESEYVKGLVEQDKEDEKTILLLRKRATLTGISESLMESLEAAPDGLHGSDLEKVYPNVDHKELSAHLKSLSLDGFLTIEYPAGVSMYKLSPAYHKQFFETEEKPGQQPE